MYKHITIKFKKKIMFLLQQTGQTYLLLFLQALCGTRVEVPTLSGERIMLDLQNEIIKPTTIKRVSGRGMPLPKDKVKRGDLLVMFDIVFPDKIASTTRDYLRNTLPPVK